MKERSREDYRTIVKALKYKALALEEQAQALRAKNQGLRDLASPLQVSSTDDLRRLRDRISHSLGVLGMSFVDYFKLFDHEYTRSIAKAEVKLDDFRLLLDQVTPAETVGFQEFSAALGKLGVGERGPGAEAKTAQKVLAIGAGSFWQRVTGGGSFSRQQLAGELQAERVGLLDILCFEDRLLEGDSFLDYELFEFRLRAMAEAAVDEGEDRDALVLMGGLQIRGETEQAEDVAAGLGFMDACLHQIESNTKFDTRRVARR